jgi:fluoroquinolone transport system permease protein
MQMTELVQKLGRNDVKLIGRDSFLIMMASYILVIAVILRFALPALNTYLIDNGVLPSETIDLSLVDVYPMLVAYLSIYLGAVFVGVIFGFVLLDEKDDNTLKALLVTPLPPSQYVLYRVGVPAVIAAFAVTVVMLVINQALVPFWQIPLLAAGAALTAPITALFFAAAAENKVQGFAMSKFVGLAGMTILIGWFIDEPAQWLFGLFPPFWVAKAYWMALAGSPWWGAVLLIGIVLEVGLILLLVRRFNRVVYD